MQLLKTNPRVSFFFLNGDWEKQLCVFFLKKKRFCRKERAWGNLFFHIFFSSKRLKKNAPWTHGTGNDTFFLSFSLFPKQTLKRAPGEKGVWKKREETLSFFFKERLEKETENKNSGKIEWFLLLLLFLFVCLGVQKMRGSGREMEEN